MKGGELPTSIQIVLSQNNYLNKEMAIWGGAVRFEADTLWYLLCIVSVTLFTGLLKVHFYMVGLESSLLFKKLSQYAL